MTTPDPTPLDSRAVRFCPLAFAALTTGALFWSGTATL